MIQFLIKGEAFLLDRHLKRLLKEFVDPATRDFNYDKISARQTAVQRAVDLLKTPPLMASSRLVLIEDFEAYSKEDAEVIAAYVGQPCESSHLIIIGAKLDKRTGFYKTLSRVAQILEFKRPYDDKIPAFVAQEARTLGLALEPGAAEMIAESAGSDLMTLVNELEKLKIFVHPESKITKKHVEDLVARGVLQNVFLITRLIGEKKFHEAYAAYLQMEEQGESVIMIASILVGHFRKLLCMAEALAENRNPSDLMGLLGIAPFFLNEYQRQARLYQPGRLKIIYARLMDLSEGLRSSRLTQGAQFEDFLKAVCLGR